MRVIKAESMCVCCEKKTAWTLIAEGSTQNGKVLVFQSEVSEDNQPSILRLEYELESEKVLSCIRSSLQARQKSARTDTKTILCAGDSPVVVEGS